MPSELTPATVSVASPRYGWLVSTVANSGALATPVSAAQTRSRRSSSGSGRAGEKPGLLRCSTEVHQPPSREVSDVLLWLVLFGRLGARVPLLFGRGFRRAGGAPRLPARAVCPLWRLARRPLLGRARGPPATHRQALLSFNRPCLASNRASMRPARTFEHRGSRIQNAGDGDRAIIRSETAVARQSGCLERSGSAGGSCMASAILRLIAHPSSLASPDIP